MIKPVSVLESEDYETIRNRAVKSIQRYCGEWSNYNASDTGIALLELLSWMQEMQEFYLEQYAMENIPLYLELLGMRPQGLAPSKVMAEVSAGQSARLNTNTAFYTDSLRFEPEQQSIVGEEMLRVCYCEKRDGSLLWKGSQEELQYGRWMFGKEPEAGNCFYMGFDRPLCLPYRKLLYFKMDVPEGMQRNPIPEGTKALFSRYRMEYWDGGRWKKCRILEDETVGFLQSGCIHWMAEGEMKCSKGLYWLRIQLVESDYDMAPRLLELTTRRLNLAQKETVAASRQITLPVNRKGIYEIPVEEYFDDPEEAEVFIKKGKTCRKAEILAWRSHRLRFSYAGKAGKSFTVLLVVRPKQSGIATAWEADGFPNQVMELGESHIMGSHLQVLVEREDCPGEYRFWKQVPHFWKEGPLGECYCFQEESGRLLFGNGEHGKIPERRILLADCVRTMGLEGQVKEGKRFKWKGGEAFGIQTVQNGRNRESDRECLKRFPQQRNDIKRAVTSEDYEALVKQTPGLMIRRVKAVSGDDNSMTLIVECAAEKKARRLNPVYQREIRSWLERKRMIGTQIQLKTPEYSFVCVRAEIQAQEGFFQAEEWIRKMVEEFFHQYMEHFGADFQYSHFYGILDGLTCVAAIHELTVTASGRGIRFQKDGSFRIPESGLAVLDEVSIRLIQGNRG